MKRETDEEKDRLTSRDFFKKLMNQSESSVLVNLNLMGKMKNEMMIESIDSSRRFDPPR